MEKKAPLNSTFFLSKLITQYAHIHRITVGSTADEYIRQIGLRTGEWIEGLYSDADQEWSVDDYAEVIVDLKNSIGGHFYIDSVFPDHVVVKATACPFGDAVKDAPHLCQMTSSVFGGIAARKFGFGKVNLRQRIAVGDAGCEVAVYFKDTDQEDGDTYENLTRTPDQGNPFKWEEETIVLLNEQLAKSDDMVMTLLSELEDLKEQVNELKSHS